MTSTDDYENKWNHNYHNLPSGCSLLPLHDQLSSPEEKEKKIPTYRSFQRKISRREKNSHIIVSEVSFSPNLAMDKYNGIQSLEASNSNWKPNQEKIIKVVFGASITAYNGNQRSQLIGIRQRYDQYLLPRDQDGNVIPSLEKH